MPKQSFNGITQPKLQLSPENGTPSPGLLSLGATEKPKFGKFVRETRIEKGLSAKAVANAMGYGYQRLYEMEIQNEWPDDGFANVCEFLGLPFRTKAEAREHYEVKDKALHQAKSGRTPMTFSDVVARLDAVGKDSPGRHSRVVDPLILKLIGTLGERHYWFGTTQTILPAAFMTEDYPKVPEENYKAMDRGALFGFLVPSESVLRKLNGVYDFPVEFSQRDFEKRHRDFVRGYVTWLREKEEKVEDPEYVAATRTQLFVGDDFPLTSCLQTVTLLGERRAIGNVFRRILLRVPTDFGRGSMLAPQNSTHEEWLHKFVETILRTEIRWGSKTDTDARDRFIADILTRMNGRPPVFPKVASRRDRSPQLNAKRKSR